MNYLGVDWGKRKIGLALGSDITKIASPFLVFHFERVEAVVEKIQKVIGEEEIKIIILGRPVRLSGEDDASEEFEKFAERLSGLGIKIIQVDERMSTKMAHSIKKQVSFNKKIDDDDLSATVILQSYFDRM